MICYRCPNCGYLVTDIQKEKAQADFVCAGCGKCRWSEFEIVVSSEENEEKNDENRS